MGFKITYADAMERGWGEAIKKGGKPPTKSPPTPEANVRSAFGETPTPQNSYAVFLTLTLHTHTAEGLPGGATTDATRRDRRSVAKSFKTTRDIF